MVTEQCFEGTTGEKVRKEKCSHKLGSWLRFQGRTTAVIHCQVTFGTGPSDFRSQDLRYQHFVDGVSGTN